MLTRTRNHLAALRSSKDEGFTLVEALVSIALTVIVMGLAMTLIVDINRNLVDTNSQAERINKAQIGLWEIQRAVRSANIIYPPTTNTDTYPNRFKVFTQTNAVRRCVEWWHDPDTYTLKSRYWSPDWESDGIATDWRVVVNGIANNPAPVAEGGSPVFTRPGGAYGDRLIEVNLQVARSTDGSTDTNPVKVDTSFTGRNTQYAYDEGVCSNTPPLNTP